MRVTTPAEARPAVDEIRSVGGDELVREMMGTFVRFATAHVQRLHDAAEHGDLEGGATIAHTIKASARQLGAHQLGEIAASAELAARGGDAAGFLRSSEDVASAFSDAKSWMEALAAAE
jgi:HPt (histidine-containing phosphotransfer) domain-containing protein